VIKITLTQKIAIKLQHFLSLCLIISLLSSCGFRLRGDYLLATELQTLYVSSVDTHGELARIVKRHLSLNKVTVMKKFSTQYPELHLLNDNLSRRTLSVFPNGQVAEYELIYSINYQLRLPNQDPKNFNFELYRDYEDDPNIALAKSRELTLFLSEMRQQAADKILREMASIKIEK
jgi:LPS-assembly lipoprotein